MITIGERLLFYRETLGMSQAKLSQKSNLTTAALSQYENNKRKPELEAFVRMCKALGVTTDTFLKGVDVEATEIIESKEEIFTEEQINIIKGQALCVAIQVVKELKERIEALEQKLKESDK